MRLTNKQLVPEIIHFVWVGCHIPEKYLKTILALGSVLKVKKPKLRIWLWCDKPINIHATASRLDIGDLEPTIAIKVVAMDLLPNMAQDSFYIDKRSSAIIDASQISEVLALVDTMPMSHSSRSEAKKFFLFERLAPSERLNLFRIFIELEAIGASNFATVSDLLRLEILRQFGGCYCDTDTEFADISFERQRILPYGVKFKLNNPETEKIETSKGTRIKKTQFYFKAGNDIIMAIPNSHIIRTALDYCLFCLSCMHEGSLTPYPSSFTHISFYDAKRCMPPLKDPERSRKKLSIEIGPRVVVRIVGYLMLILLADRNPGHDTTHERDFFEIFNALNIDRVFGIKVISNSEISWMDVPEDCRRPRAYSSGADNSNLSKIVRFSGLERKMGYCVELADQHVAMWRAYIQRQRAPLTVKLRLATSSRNKVNIRSLSAELVDLVKLETSYVKVAILAQRLQQEFNAEADDSLSKCRDLLDEMRAALDPLDEADAFKYMLYRIKDVLNAKENMLSKVCATEGNKFCNRTLVFSFVACSGALLTAAAVQSRPELRF